MAKGFAIGIVALAGMITLATWLLPTDTGTSIAFADVQKRLENVKSLSFTFTNGAINATTRNPESTGYSKILGNDYHRVEYPNGDVHIADLKKKRMLYLRNQEKKAELTIGFDPKGVMDFYDKMRNWHKESIKTLPDREIDGKVTKGFVVEELGREMKVWVDADTKLPVRVEVSAKTKQFIGGKEANIDIMTDFVFDKALDKGLFDTTPPADYVVKTIRIPTLTSEQRKKDAALVIIPKDGFGKAKFGMSLDEVIQHLGEPDEIKNREAPSSIGWKVPDGGTFLTSDESKDIVTYQILDYRSRGFTITIHPTEGFRSVRFQEYPKDAPIGRTFQGKTDKGIGMNATRDAILKAYGQPGSESPLKTPDGKITSTNLNYFDLSLHFTLRDDNVVRMGISVPAKSLNSN